MLLILYVSAKSIWGGLLLPLALWTVSIGGDSATGPGWVRHTWGAGQVLQHRICILIYEVTSNVSLPFFCEVPPPPNRALEVIFPMKIKPSNKFCCSEKCQQSHVCGEVKVVYFYTKFVNRFLKPTKNCTGP